MTTADQLNTVITSLRPLVAGTRPEQLTDATPCSKWTVRDLLNHFVGGGHMFAAAFRGVPADPHAVEGPMPDVVGDDPLAAFDRSIADFDDAISAPDAPERMVTLPIGTMPGEVVLQLATFDLMVHSWDLARATGQDYEPPADLVAAADGYGRALIAPEIRDGDVFAAEVTPATGATPIERLVAFAGRDL